MFMHAFDTLPNELFLRSFIIASPNGISLVDKSGFIIEWNPAMEELTGITSEAAIGKYAWDIQGQISDSTSNLKVETFKKMFLQVVRGESDRWLNHPISHTIKNVISSKKYTVISTSFLLKSENIKMIGMIMRDMTELEQVSQDNRKLSEALINLQASEHRRLSQDLHDNVCQLIAAVKLQVGHLSKSSGLQTAEYQDQLNTIMETLSETENITRNMMSYLHPMILEDISLAAAIREMIRTIQKRFRYQIKVVGSKLFDTLKNHDQQIQIYMIIQECLVNTGKHANASLVKIYVQSDEHGFQLKISDNGKGFLLSEPKVSRTEPHLGLKIMRARAEMVSGNLSIQSHLNKGTEVMLTIPNHPKVN